MRFDIEIYKMRFYAHFKRAKAPNVTVKTRSQTSFQRSLVKQDVKRVKSRRCDCQRFVNSFVSGPLRT